MSMASNFASAAIAAVIAGEADADLTGRRLTLRLVAADVDEGVPVDPT